jgi:hypothetical protein
MIVATRLNAVWRVAGVAAAALCCYLVSQSVAAERAGLEKVDHQISATRAAIAKLQTEIGVRSRQGQLEAWNRDVLALQAPRPSQFVSSGLQLASLYGRHGQPALQLDPAITSQQGSPTNVSYQPAPATPQQEVAPSTGEAQAPSPAQPMLRAATYVRPAPSRLGVPVGIESGASVQKASFEVIRTSAPAPHADLPKPKPAGTVTQAAAAASGARGSRSVETKPAAKKAASAEFAAREPLSRSLLPADISVLAARETKSSKAAR